MSENLITAKPHYRAVILVLASSFPHNKMYRRVWKQYFKKDSALKVIFVYGASNNILEDYDTDYDIVSETIQESLSIHKVLEAFKIVDSRYSYDFLVRTNLSTFWDFEKLHKHLDTLPNKLCYSGDGPLPGYAADGYYLSGTDTIVTPEMIRSINENNHLVNFSETWEDQAMGRYFHGTLGAPMLPNRICFFEDLVNTNQIELIHNRIAEARTNDKDHYRVKNIHGNREELDYCVYKELLKIIYGL